MPPVLYIKNRTLRVDQTQIVDNALARTTLSADSAASASTLTLLNTDKFAVGKYVWINPFSERSELIAVHASTAPVQSTGVLTLAANTVFAHSAGEPVYYVEFNQVEYSTASTVTGSKSVLTTVALEPGNREVVYLDTATSSGYYFARYKDSVATTFGNYCGAMPFAGWDKNTVGYMIGRALADLNVKLSELVTIADCIEWLNSGLKLIQGKLKRWPEHFSYNAVLGQAQRGTNVLTMPTDAYDTETNKSVVRVHIGTNPDLTYLTPDEFEAQLQGVAVTQVTTQATSGSTSLAINNSYDFADSGTVHVFVSGTMYSLTYTGVTRSSSAGALTGIPSSGTGSITVTIAASTYVWQNEKEGTPLYWTVRNGNIEWYPLTDAAQDNANVYGDYAKVATSVDTIDDTIDFQRYDMLQDYLTWRVKMKARNNGALDEQDGFYTSFRTRMNDAIRTLPANNQLGWAPKLNTMNRGTNRTANDMRNVPYSQQ